MSGLHRDLHEAPGAAPRRGLVPVSFIRPYEEDIRRIVVHAVMRAGATPQHVFRPPLAYGDIERYLVEHGRADRLIVPFYKSTSDSGVEIVACFHAAGGVPRRILMPTRHALPSVVMAALRAAIGDAAERVLVLTVASMDAHADAIRAHLAGQVSDP